MADDSSDESSDAESWYSKLIEARGEVFRPMGSKTDTLNSEAAPVCPKPVVRDEATALPGFAELKESAKLTIRNDYEKTNRESRAKLEFEKKYRESTNINLIKAKNAAKAASEELNAVISGDFTPMNAGEKVYQLPGPTWHVPLTSFEVLSDDIKQASQKKKFKSASPE